MNTHASLSFTARPRLGAKAFAQVFRIPEARMLLICALLYMVGLGRGRRRHSRLPWLPSIQRFPIYYKYTHVEKVLVPHEAERDMPW